MTDELQERKKKVLFYRALSKMSDECEVPVLTPDCPFYVRQDDGSAVCAEECRDILSDDLSPALDDTDSSSSYDLGNEIQAIRRPKSIRPKPRRGPSPEDRPFDAAEVYMRERSRDLETWSMPALLGGLRAQFAWMNLDDKDPPDFQRAKELMGVLKTRGVDAEAVIRQGFISLFIGCVMWHIYSALELDADDCGWLTLLKKIAPDGELLSDEGRVDERRLVDYVAPKVSRHVIFWSLTVPLEELFYHRAPEEPYEIKWSEIPPRDLEIQWFVDRFSETYLYNWHSSSWTREWRWIHSARPGCCPPGHMRDRVIDDNELAGILADQACAREDNDTARRFREDSKIHVAQFTAVALDTIKSGNVSEAVALYRAIIHVVPDDWQAANNLGFCLIPVSPREAIEYLERSVEAPKRPAQLLPMTHLNLALAKYRCGDFSGALESIADARNGPSLNISGSMWVPGDAQTLQRVESLEDYADVLESLVSEARRTGAE